MSEVVYYYYHEKQYHSPRFLNVYASIDADSGGFVDLDDKENDGRWWKCSGPALGATSQTGLKNNKNARRITRCAARKLLRKNGLSHLELF